MHLFYRLMHLQSLEYAFINITAGTNEGAAVFLVFFSRFLDKNLETKFVWVIFREKTRQRFFFW